VTCRTWRKPHFFLIEFQVLMKSPLFWTKKNHPPQRNLTLQDGSLVPNRFPLRLKHFSFRRGDGNPILKWWEHTDSDASFNIWNFHVYLYIYIWELWFEIDQQRCWCHQTKNWTIHHLPTNDFPISLSIHTGFPIATFEDTAFGK
jgi:hypothetical protein